jgi:anthranilate phosphoribosyltransferase
MTTMVRMSIAPYLREIGRGKDGARALSRDKAFDLMSQLLDGQLSDLEKGGFALAMRIKGETPEELAGFMDAVVPRTLALHAPSHAIVLPSYNGARKLPNLTPLLALLLARAGVPVLVHGVQLDANRTTSAQVFEALDLPPVSSAADAESRWAAGQPVFMPIAALHPSLAALLALRNVLGLRNSGHTLAKRPCRAHCAWSTTRTPNTPSAWPSSSVRRVPRRCCCAARRASRWPMRAGCRRSSASSTACSTRR